MERFDVLVIGGGAAGMAAAAAAAEAGGAAALVEREPALGGILRQCLHRGFGRTVFGADVSGPEFAEYWIRRVGASGAAVFTDTCVISLDRDRTALLSGPAGCRRIGFHTCILAAGCYERTVESLPAAGTRPAGIYTAGTAQALMNLGHYSVGNRIVILGSGDVGQIMARQFAQAEKEVVCLIEQRGSLGGLARNRRDCIEAYRIPVRLRTALEEICGRARINGVIVRDLDTGRREMLECDALVTAIGLIPDRTLCRSLHAPEMPAWLKLCGNCDYVHDMVDNVIKEASALGAEALRKR